MIFLFVCGVLFLEFEVMSGLLSANFGNDGVNDIFAPRQPSAREEISTPPSKESKRVSDTSAEKAKTLLTKKNPKNLEGCIPPIGFPIRPLRVDEMPYVCRNLKYFDELLESCMQQKAIQNPEECEPCMPPKQMDTLPPWLVQMTNTVIYNELKYRNQRRREILKLIESNQLVPSPHGIVLMTLNWGYKHLFLNWVCGLAKLSIPDVRQNTLIIASDPESFALSRDQVGFPATLNGSWIEGEFVTVS
ncbi:hypothetical protein RFI_10307 [Reticulomyxa filosa]|uniref:Uncharacterized protein n=1 Tax=Reticulomyxa filosa TaxID=46433 RepID=X6NM83_RETFI|nr:hypothetical protein RFI_10307 [Reticulomyxa filosa]|eukprot:ETO26824.1 hypothetical protein RFI_10307 [Reticulomyxa filosa]